MFVSILKGKIKYDPIIKTIKEDTIINFVIEASSVPFSTEVKSLVRCSINISDVKNEIDFKKGNVIYAKGISSNVAYQDGTYTFNLMVNYYEIIENNLNGEV